MFDIQLSQKEATNVYYSTDSVEENKRNVLVNVLLEVKMYFKKE